MATQLGGADDDPWCAGHIGMDASEEEMKETQWLMTQNILLHFQCDKWGRTKAREKRRCS